MKIMTIGVSEAAQDEMKVDIMAHLVEETTAVIERETVMMEGVSLMMQTGKKSITEREEGLPMAKAVVEVVNNRGLAPVTNAVKMATSLKSVQSRKRVETSVEVADSGSKGEITVEKEGAMEEIEEMIAEAVAAPRLVYLVNMQEKETLDGAARVGQEQEEELGMPAGECRDFSAESCVSYA